MVVGGLVLGDMCMCVSLGEALWGLGWRLREACVMLLRISDLLSSNSLSKELSRT